MIPEGIVTTGWPQVEAKGLELGLGFDWWQCSLGRVALGKRTDGKYAATVGGVVLSIPRQVGKTYFVGALVILLCILFPGLQVVWTAHRTRTATRTFRSLQGMARRKKIWPHVLSIRIANGEQEIAFRNGSMVMFGAREQGFGRGFDEIDVEVFDEAQILTEKALEDMIAATNQARHPHGALLFYMGTPPRPVDPGEIFSLKRKKALGGEKGEHVVATRGDMVYLECSGDPDADPDDPRQWAKANFSYPQRTPHESMLRLRENLGTDEGWFREGLGIWDPDDARLTVFGAGKWEAAATTGEEFPAVAVIGVAVSIDRLVTSIGSAGLWPDGRSHVGATDRREGVAWAPAEAVRIQLAHGCLIVIDEKGPAGDLIGPIEEAGGQVTRASLNDYLDACALIFDGVQDGSTTHAHTDELDAAVRDASWRYVGDRRAFARKTGDVSMLEAVALANWAALGRVSDMSPINNVW